MAKSDLAAAAVELSTRPGGERYLADALEGRLDGYGFVFLDCPPSFGPLTVNALAAAERVLVPVQAEYYALEGLSQLLGTVNLVKARLNPELAVAGILLTMADGRTRLAAEVESELRRHFGDLVFTHDRAPLGAPRRGAEPRASCDRVRPALGGRRGVLEGGDGACRAFLRSGAASAAASRCCWVRRASRSCCTSPSSRFIRTRASRGRRFEPEAAAGLAASIRLQGVLQPIVVRRRAEGGFELIAGERRWRAAQCGRDPDAARARPRCRRQRLAAARARRERRARAAVPGRGGARLRVARGRVRALARRGRRARRPLEVGGVEPPAPARAPRGGAVDARPRRPHGGPRAGGARAPGRRRPQAPRAPNRARTASASAQPSAQPEKAAPSAARDATVSSTRPWSTERRQQPSA